MAGIVLIGLQARIGKRPGKLSARQLRLSLAWLGLAWLGLAWLGLAWLGLAKWWAEFAACQASS